MQRQKLRKRIEPIGQYENGKGLFIRLTEQEDRTAIIQTQRSDGMLDRVF